MAEGRQGSACCCRSRRASRQTTFLPGPRGLRPQRPCGRRSPPRNLQGSAGCVLVEGDDRVIEPQPAGSPPRTGVLLRRRAAPLRCERRVGIVAEYGESLNAPDPRVFVADEKSRSRSLRPVHEGRARVSAPSINHCAGTASWRRRARGGTGRGRSRTRSAARKPRTAGALPIAAASAGVCGRSRVAGGTENEIDGDRLRPAAARRVIRSAVAALSQLPPRAVIGLAIDVDGR